MVHEGSCVRGFLRAHEAISSNSLVTTAPLEDGSLLECAFVPLPGAANNGLLQITHHLTYS